MCQCKNQTDTSGHRLGGEILKVPGGTTGLNNIFEKEELAEIVASLGILDYIELCMEEDEKLT